MGKKIFIVVFSLFFAMLGLSSCNNNTEKSDDDTAKTQEQTFAADTLLSEDGSFGNDSDGLLTVAFIGGSLTDAQSYTTEEGKAYGGKYWTNIVCDYLTEKFPNRTIKPINSGIGGTGTDYGALRFEDTILRFEPDIVFYDTINDCGFGKEHCQKYMEAMTRMTQQCEKVPVFIYLYTPYPDYYGTVNYERWKENNGYKQEIADYYGIGNIDIYSYLFSCFDTSGYTDFYEFIASTNQYVGSGTTWDPHGGYKFYAEAILKVFNENPGSVIKRPIIREEWFENGLYKDIALIKYNIIRPTSDRFTYTGKWKLYNIENSVSAPAYFVIEKSHGEYAGMSPHKDKHGIMTTTDQTATLEFSTDANSVIINFKTVNEPYDMATDVYIDGEFSKEIHSSSIYVGMSYILTLADFSDGQTHNIKLVMKPSESEIPAFEFVYIGEGYTEAGLKK